MKSTQALDRAILEIVEQYQPCKMDKIVDQVERLDGHRRGMKSNRGIIERVYDLKREGKLAMQGERNHARYILPGYRGAEPTEAQQQIAEGRKRETPPIPSASVVVVMVEEPHDDLPAGWSSLREQLEAGKEIQEIMPTPSSPAPITPAMPPIVQRAPLNFEISALAGDVAAQVALTVERVVGPGIKRQEAIIADLQRQLLEKDRQIEEAREGQLAAEQLAEEAEEKYKALLTDLDRIRNR